MYLKKIRYESGQTTNLSFKTKLVFKPPVINK